MNFLKVFFVLLMVTGLSFTVSAQCSVSTSCGDYTFENCSSVSVQETSVNGQTTVQVFVDGQLAVNETCDADQGEDGGFDICDYIDCESLCALGFPFPFCE